MLKVSVKVTYLATVSCILVFGWLIPKFNSAWQVTLGTLTFLSLMLILTNSQTRRYIKKEYTLKYWIVFALVSLLGSYLNAFSFQYALNKIILLIAYLALYFTVVVITSIDGDCAYISETLGWLCFILALLSLRNGISDDVGRIAVGKTFGTNTLACYMLYGIMMLFLNLKLSKTLACIFRVSAISVMAYVLILTGSRKYLVGALIFIIGWFVTCYVLELKQSRKKTWLLTLSVSVIAIILISYYIYGWFVSTTMYGRFLSFISEPTAGDLSRTDMYKAGFEYFKQQPLLGIGYGNFELVYYNAAVGRYTYSHSTYVEALACTGIIGSLFYFMPYFKTIKRLVTTRAKCKDGSNTISNRSNILLMLVMLWLAFGTIHYYDSITFIVFAVINARCSKNYGAVVD